jgi:hypothetical protein
MRSGQYATSGRTIAVAKGGGDARSSRPRSIMEDPAVPDIGVRVSYSLGSSRLGSPSLVLEGCSVALERPYAPLTHCLLEIP